MDESDTTPFVASFCVLLGLTVIGFAVVWHHIVAVETQQRGLPVTVAVFTPINKILVLGFTGLLGLYSSQIAHNLFSVSTCFGKAASIVLQFSIGLCEWACLQYTWNRTKPILLLVSPERVGPMKWAVRLSPGLFFSQVVTALMLAIATTVDKPNPQPFDSLNNLFIGIAGITATLLDTVFLVTFIRFLRTKHTALPSDQLKLFQTVARYGCWTAAALYVCSIMAPRIMFLISPAFIGVSFWILFEMKRAIWKIATDVGVASDYEGTTNVAVGELESGVIVPDKCNTSISDVEGGSVIRGSISDD
ncbi:hypothetical protein BCR33DRAFT_714210, partial [Rhizoclosmatium globosum]